MKNLLTTLILILAFDGFAQEIVSPMMTNPSLYRDDQKSLAIRSGTILDSTFIYSVSNLDIQYIWDDFSIDKFVSYPPDFNAPNVTAQWHFCLMDATNTIQEPDTVKFCDSLKARLDTVTVVSGVATTFTTLFTPHSIWVNDLNTYPIIGQLMNLYDECYIITDSIYYNVTDTVYVRDTTYYTNAPTFMQDSIHLFFADLNDTNNIWIDNRACRNFNMGVDPWSLGVATLDGIDSTGWPYEFGTNNAYGQADVMTSKPINLNTHSNVFLQFLYQPKGFGNMPEDQDSLIVDFYLVDSAKWYPSWYATPPFTANLWDTAFIAVPSNFLDNGFQFRFRNYASISGALDHWHIDYVQLSENPLLAVQSFKDLAVSYPLYTLLDDYTSVPWDHYKNLTTPNDQMIETSFLQVYNSDVDPTNVGSGMELGISYNGSVQGTYLLGNPAGPLPWTSNWLLGMNDFPFQVASNHAFFDAPGNDSMAVFDVKINADAAVAGSNVFTVNDVAHFEQVFKNYYAYDDGSAEIAYGVQGFNSKLAYEFNAYEADTLTGILMHFVPTVTDVSSNIMLLTVWDDNGGEPGEILYQDDFFLPHYPEYGGSKNEFKYYEFMNPNYPSEIQVPQKFYVGWEQVESQSLNIGMDRNIINNSKIHYNVGGTWAGSSQQGSLMIRPVFSTAIDHTLFLESDEPISKIVMYPNPATHEVMFKGLTGKQTITVCDMSGRSVANSLNLPSVDIDHLTSGVYLVNVVDNQGISILSEKLVKN